MPGIYRKKKRVVGPSKNEEKVERQRQAESMSAVAARYPSVQSIKVSLNFLGAQQQSLGEETRSYGPGDSCDFAVPCPGMCGVGSFDLAAKIASVVTAGEGVSESSGVCQEQAAAGPCGASLKCRIEVAYK
jgi:hypothetical protein